MINSLTLHTAILQSLAFEGMFSRRNNIESRHPQTCTWILENEKFQGWFQQKHGLLWVKGIPGAGKSTLMAFLHDHFRQHTQQNTIRLDFFFSARGTPLQKQFPGLLRSLIYQIFKSDESIRPRIRRLFLEKVSESLGSTQDLVWHQRELESLFSEVLEVSAQAKDVLVFVDALDEAGTDLARHIALYFHRLNEGIASQAGGAKFCISSRHYPIVITIPGTEIIVENYNRADIERYIFENLPLDHLLGPHVDDSRIWLKLQLDLVHKASGSFQWARLVVPIVEKHITDGSSALKIYDILQKVPNALHEAYSHIIEHVINPEDRLRSLLLFQWACLAQRPLSLAELRYAMVVNTLSKDQIHNKVSQLRDFVKYDDQMIRQTRALSGGLIEIVEISGKLSVEPIHQSVNDFLLAGGLAMLCLLTQQSTVQSLPDSIEFSHSTLFQSCVRYLQLDGLHVIIEDAQKLSYIEQQLKKVTERITDYEFDRTRGRQYLAPRSSSPRGFPPRDSLDGEESMLEANNLLATISESTYVDDCKLWDHLTETGNHILDQWHHLPRFSWTPYPAPLPSSFVTTETEWARTFSRGGSALAACLIDKHAPFLWYALSNLLFHAEKLQTGYFMTDTNRAEDFESIIGMWRRGQRMLGNLQGDHAHPNSGSTLLHIGAAANVVSLIQYCLMKGRCIDVNVVDAGGNTPLHLAISGGHLEALQVLLEARPNILMRNKENHTPLATAFRFSRISAASSIIRSYAGIAKYQSELERILGIASLKGSEPLVRLLIHVGIDVNAKGAYALFKAAKYGHLNIVHYLLEAGADINAGPSLSDGGPLPAACLQGHEKVVEYLLVRKNQIKESELRAGLARAKFRGHFRLVEMFRFAGIE